MGIIISRFKKKSTVQALEKLENEIKEREKWKSYFLTRQKNIAKYLRMYFMAALVVCCIILYQLSSVLTLKNNFFICLALILSPSLIYIIGKMVSWYYIHLIKKYQMQLNKKNEEKNRILDEVKKTETYNSAKEILEKFAAESPPKQNLQVSPISNQNLRKRPMIVPNQNTKHQSGMVLRNQMVSQDARVFPRDPVFSRSLQVIQSTVPQLPAPILPLNRSYVDRVVEYLLGDGPNNRYALICSQCHSHNGMALKEEFEYVSFKCCYCFFHNPARKKRPEAPKLESPMKLNNTSDSDSDSRSTQSDVSSKAETNTKQKRNSEANSTDEDFEELQLPNKGDEFRLIEPELNENEKVEKSLENENVKVLPVSEKSGDCVNE